MRSLATYIVTMDDAESLTYNSNDKNRGGMGYFCDIETKQKNCRNRFARAIRRIRIEMRAHSRGN